MPINVGILGLAHGHVGVYVNQWRNDPFSGVRVTAAWDHDAARAAGAKVEVMPSAEALVARKDVNAVVIAL